MQLARRELRGVLTFTIELSDGDHEYTVPAAGIDAGFALAKVFTSDEAALAKSKMQYPELFTLAMGDVWQQMRADGVALPDAFRAGMACLSRERTLLFDDSPARWDNAEAAAAAIWASGIDPELYAASMAAMNESKQSGTASTNRATRRAEASTTKTPASGRGTKASQSKTGRG